MRECHPRGRRAALTPGTTLISDAVGWLGAGALVAAGLVVLAAGIGVRLLRGRAEVPRAIGVFALTLAAVFAALGIALTVLSPAAMQLIDAGGLVMLTAVVLAPMGPWRCPVGA